MLLQEELNETSFTEKLAMITMWTFVIVMWLVVLGCALFGMVVLLWRELEGIG
jgi:hypothetical protein